MYVMGLIEADQADIAGKVWNIPECTVDFRLQSKIQSVSSAGQFIVKKSSKDGSRNITMVIVYEHENE